ncbi:uracil-DNA glycosylase family protein [Alsobacter sp. KACC 23698]|uniref:Uracil-DNA glycosylase family protein n=1 Tax=Alsobacter sp. KACC 23698 TaxID=3149229 RepID=A0AAU7JIE8_9HYPH
MSAQDLDDLLAAIRLCRICRDAPWKAPLPHEPRPVLQASFGARLFIVGQAPGTKVHASGRPFTDASGDRLREWLGIGEDAFYDPARVAILPMGFCFPGQDAKGGDLPPRPECAAAWRERLLALMPPPRLTVGLGLHALKWHLSRLGRRDLLAPTLDATVADWARIHAEAGMIPLPHPSWRNTGWIKRNPWFARDLLPVLRAEAAAAIGPD